ncbi:hypothetical protein [Bacillus cereus]|uniref:hypothetical protein n=1 Tax=Bacillus cereus TaxID=1396 RepID=UPI001AB04CAD|nr:hypothetical protein [Bacillus cereus]
MVVIPRKKSFMLPIEFLEGMKQLDMGTGFYNKNKTELEQAIEMGKIIKRLLDHNEIFLQREFINKRYYFY